jgi:hypothetical protein
MLDEEEDLHKEEQQQGRERQIVFDEPIHAMPTLPGGAYFQSFCHMEYFE